MGLLGTVIGMIRSFAALAAGGSADCATNADLRIAIKADADTPYSVIKNVMNTLQDLRENRYNLITSLKTTAED